MKRTWIRRDPEPNEAIASGVLALVTAFAVGTATWYITRTLLSREPISLRPEDGIRPVGSGDGARLESGAPPGDAG